MIPKEKYNIQRNHYKHLYVYEQYYNKPIPEWLKYMRQYRLKKIEQKRHPYLRSNIGTFLIKFD